jgi:uncharacterized repeat protein (TIGR01451 family)
LQKELAGPGPNDVFASDAFLTVLGPSIVLEKHASREQVRPGEVVTYTITAHNRGSRALEGVLVHDDLSGVLDRASLVGHPTAHPGSAHVRNGHLLWSGTLEPDETATISYSVRVHEGLTGGLLFNGVTTPGGICRGRAPLEPCVSQTEILHPGGPDLTMTKTASIDGKTLHPGGQVTYLLTVHNRGPGPASGVMLEDPAPSGISFTHVEWSQGLCTLNRALRCALGTIVSGGGALVKVSATVAAGATGRIVNRATVWGDQGSNVSTTSDVHVSPRPLPPPGKPGAQPLSHLVLRKRVDRHVARLGQRLRYTLTIINRGPQRAALVILKDTPKLPVRLLSIHPSQGRCRRGPPLTCVFGLVRSGGRVRVVIRALPTVAGVLTNTAAVTSAGKSPCPQCSIDSARTRILRAPPPPRFTG